MPSYRIPFSATIKAASSAASPHDIAGALAGEVALPNRFARAVCGLAIDHIAGGDIAGFAESSSCSRQRAEYLVAFVGQDAHLQRAGQAVIYVENGSYWRAEVRDDSILVSTESVPDPEDVFIDESEDDPDIESGINAMAWVREKRSYVYDDRGDVYHIYLNSAKLTFSIPGVHWRGIKRMYSDVDGKRYTINEVADHFGLERAWLIEILRAMGMTHDALPFTDEEISDQSDQELAEAALAMKRGVVKQRIRDKERKLVEEQAQKYALIEDEWRLSGEVFEEGARSILSELRKENEKWAYTPTPPAVILPDNVDWEGILAPSDVHYGKYAWADETGNGFDRKECEARLFAKTEMIAADLGSRPVKTLYVPFGNDWFNFDNVRAMTSSGRVFPDSEGSPFEVYVGGQNMAAKLVEFIKRLFPRTRIVMVLVPGNHDRAFATATYTFLAAYFRGDDRVEFTTSFRHLQHLRSGRSVVSLTHGDGLVESATKRRNLAVRILQETKRWDGVYWNYCFNGHLHTLRQEDVGGVIFRQFMSLGGDDRWHAENGYVGSLSGLSGVLIHPEAGIRSEFYAPVLSGDEERVAARQSLGIDFNDLERSIIAA